MSEPLSTLETLRGARRWLAANPDRWTQNGGWLDRQGNACAVGACALTVGIEPCQVGLHIERLTPVLRTLAPLCPDYVENAILEGCVAHFNDTHSHAEVLALFDKAIAAEEERLGLNKPAPETVPQAAPRRRENVGCERERVLV